LATIKEDILMKTGGESSQSKTKFKIIRDSREKEGKGWNFRASANCSGIEVEKLNVGDYTIKGLEKVLMIERKTLGDLWNTLGGIDNYKRFLREMERAKNHTLKYLIVEATLAEVNKGYSWFGPGGRKKRSKVSANNVIAKLISLEVKYGIHVIFAGRMDHARSHARSIMNKVFRYHEDGLL
jgi:ERCC4-type nuclease